MKMNKVLILHGPIISSGINFLSAQIFRTPQERKSVRAEFNSAENTRSLAKLFRMYGYKIIYSGWNEDEEWIRANSNLFDAFCISNQSLFPDETLFQSRPIQNNKQKLFFGCLAGVKLVQEKFGSECVVVRMRSDICVDVKAIDQEVIKANGNPKSILIEYANPSNTYFVPDFLFISTLPVQLKIYQHLVDINARDESYHISSHIDLGATFLMFLEQKELDSIILMHKRIYESMVWRGIPRYFELAYKKSEELLFFDCFLIYPKDFSLQDLIKAIPPELSGRDMNKVN
jgi:hypothetical protein